MKKILLVGSVSCGKTTLCQRLNGLTLTYKKTQSVEVIQETIDTPGEYLEHRVMLRNLLVSSADVELILFLQDASSERFMYSGGQASAFSLPVAGVITKCDLATEKQIQQAEELLEMTGAAPIFKISSVEGTGMDALLRFLA